MTGPRVPLDPSAGAHALAAMIRHGEPWPTPPIVTTAPCRACGCTCRQEGAL